jgi:hypothetical protein
LRRALPGRDDARVFWRRPRPPLTERDVDDVFHALWEIKKGTQLILAILRDEEEEPDEP